MFDTNWTASRDAISAVWPSSSRFDNIWAIVDGAQDDRIYPAIKESRLDHCCLFAGDLGPALKSAAPYLVRLERDGQFTRFVLESGWGRAWCSLLASDVSLDTLRRHLRKFLRVTDESGRRLLFRFYDPRVLAIYLPTCNSEELTTFFGPIDRFVVESENGNSVLEYRFTGLKLESTRVELQSSAAKL